MNAVTVRRIRQEDWQRVRDLRLESLGDESAPIAFLETLESSRTLDDAFWRERASAGARSDSVAQFVAELNDAWVGSVAVLLRRGGVGTSGGSRRTDARCSS